jgi:protein-disulfide isomerase
MITPETGRHKLFSKRLLVVLLVISVFANIILITKLKFPETFHKIQIAFISAPDVVPTDHIRGNPKAKYTIIEYTDLQCPYCAQFHETMSAVMKQADVRWVFRHFPLPSHPFAQKAAEASECAGEQGKFWEYSDALFALKGNLTDATFAKLARDLKLDVNSFSLCVSSGKYAAVVEAQREGGVKKLIRGTPTFWLNGKRFEGSVPLDELRKMVGVIPESKS